MKITCLMLVLSCFMICSCSSSRYIQTDLYFGRMKPDGDSVSLKDWNTFVRNDISKAFPAGFTIVNAQGNWRSPESGQMISENSQIVILIHKKQRSVDALIDSLRGKYKSAFKQEAVLRVDKKAKASF